MKNKMVYLIAAIIILALLAVLYTLEPNNDNTKDSSEENLQTNNKIALLNIENTNQINIKNKEGKYTISLSEDKYTVKGYEKNSFSQKDFKQLFNASSLLTAEKLIEENPADLSKYGLAQPEATANIKGNIEKTLNIGNLTSDKKYRYVNISGDKSVYIANKSYAELFTKNIKSFIDKTLVTFSADAVNYVNIKQKNKPEILIDTKKENSTLKNYVSSSGLSAYIMDLPIKDAIVYPTNMQEVLLCDLKDFVISDIAELNIDNINKYGLDNPNMDITLKSSSDTLRLRTGNKANDKDVYVLINDRPEIYTIDKDCFSTFENVNIMDFIQNFVTLHPRSTVKNINIVKGNTKHLIEFKEKGENKIAVDSEGVKRDNRNTSINGVIINKETFGDFYEMLSGISFDSVEYNPQNIPDMSNSQYKISYTLNDNTVEEIDFYNYNDNFYFIKKENNLLLVNKQQINQLENKIKELTK